MSACLKALCQRRFVIAIFSVVAGYLFAGCGFAKSREAAEKVVNRHFQMIATNGYAAALADYAPQFFLKTSKDEWAKELANLASQLGPYQHHYIDTWKVVRTNSIYGPGSTVRFEMQVAYSRRNAVENFTIFKPAADANYQIVEHTIKSEDAAK